MATQAYHINAKGEAGRCSAQHGRCPFGGADEHHSTPEAARAAYEASQGAQTVAGALVRKQAAGARYASSMPSSMGAETRALSEASVALSSGSPAAREAYAQKYYAVTPSLQGRARPAADQQVRKLVLA